MSAVPPSPPARPKASVVLDDAFQRLRIPPTAYRVALGVLVFLGIYIGAVGVPTYAVQLLNSHNVPINLSLTNLMYYGGAMALLGAAAYAVRPYRAYGPVAIATDGAELLYLWLLYTTSPLNLSFGGGGGSGGAIAVGYAAIMLILMFVVVFHLAGDAVTTYEDFSHPAERLYCTYPAR